MVWNTRAHKRRTLIFYIEVYEKGTDKLLGKIGDLTPGGVMLISNTTYKKGSVFDVCLKIPEALGIRETHLDVSIEVQWSKLDKNPSLIATGCKFLPMTEEKTHVVERIIKVMAFKDDLKKEEIG